MRFNLSISLRLTLWFSAIFLCGFVVFGVFIWFDLSASLGSGKDRTLGRRYERMVDLLKHAEKDSDALLQTKYREFVDATPEGGLIQVYSLSGERLLPQAGSAAMQFPWPAVPSALAEYRSDVWIGNHPYRIYLRSATLNGAPVRICVAGSLMDNVSLLARLDEIFERSIPAMLLISALAGYFISHRALRPVVRLTESARSITIGNLAARLPVSPAGDELAQLAETCNEMLSRLEDRTNCAVPSRLFAPQANTRFAHPASTRKPLRRLKTS